MAKLSFSIKQKAAISIFKRYRNDITIFTEDKETNEKKFYKIFFSKLMKGSGIIINDIFPVGSCDEVDNLEKNDHDYSIPKIYITDGDIYLMYSPKKERKRFYPLNRYCIENFLIEEKQLCNAAAYLSRNLEAEDIKKLLNYHDVMMDFANHIVPIFYYYCILSKFGGFKIDGYGKYYDNQLKKFKETVIQNEIIKMNNILLNERNISNEKILKEFMSLERKFPINIETVVKCVSAKNFTFGYLSEILKTKCGINIGVEHEVWKKICAENLDYNSLLPLRNKIIFLCKGK